MRKFKVKVNGKEYVVEIEEIKEEAPKENEPSEAQTEKPEEN